MVLNGSVKLYWQLAANISNDYGPSCAKKDDDWGDYFKAKHLKDAYIPCNRASFCATCIRCYRSTRNFQQCSYKYVDIRRCSAHIRLYLRREKFAFRI